MYKNDFSKLSQFFCFCVTPMYDVVFYTKEITVEIGNFFFIFVVLSSFFYHLYIKITRRLKFN